MMSVAVSQFLWVAAWVALAIGSAEIAGQLLGASEELMATHAFTPPPMYRIWRQRIVEQATHASGSEMAGAHELGAKSTAEEALAQVETLLDQAVNAEVVKRVS